MVGGGTRRVGPYEQNIQQDASVLPSVATHLRMDAVWTRKLAVCPTASTSCLAPHHHRYGTRTGGPAPRIDKPPGARPAQSGALCTTGSA